MTTKGNVLESFNKHSKKIIIGVVGFVAISLLAVGITWWLYKDADSDVLATVGNEKIVQTDLDKAMYSMAFSDDTSIYSQEDKDKQLKQLIEFAIARKEASTLGIDLSESELDEYIKSAIGDKYSSYTQEQKNLTRETSKNSLLLEKVKERAIGWREANYLVVNFHKYFTTDSKEYQVEGMGNERLIQKTKSDALAYATSLSNRLKNKSLNYEAAKKELYANEEFGADALLPRTPDMGGQIKKDYFIQGILDQNLRESLFNLGLNEVSEPIVDTGRANEMGDKELEYRYIVYEVTAVGNSNYSSYEEWFSAMKAKYKVDSTNIISLLSQKVYAASPASCDGTCNIDNAELYITFQYYTAAGGLASLTTGSFDVQGGTPWATNDGGNCDAPARSSGIDGTPNPTWSSCDTAGKSFYCASDSVMYLVLHPNVPIAGTDPAKGVWTWDEQTGANTYSGFPSGEYTPGSRWRDNYNGTAHTWGTDWADLNSPGMAIALINLRAGRNAENEQMNGKLLWEVFRWHPYYLPNTTPVPVAVSACQNADCDGNMQVDSNGGASVQLTAKATDAENDLVAVQVMYKKVGDTGWKNFGTGGETASPDGTGTSAIIYGSNAYATNTVSGTIPADINAFGWRSISSGNPNSAANTNISLPSVYLSPGTYSWSVRAVDSKLAYSGWSKYSTFIVSAPAPTISCEVTPQTGLSPLVVVVRASVVNPVLGVNYTFNYNMGDGSVLTGRTSPIYYTYPASAVGQMNISVTSDNISGFTCPCTTTIQNPTNGGGGEVAL